MSRGDTYEEKRAKARMEKLEQLQKDAAAALTSYAWVDKKKGHGAHSNRRGDANDSGRSGREEAGGGLRDCYACTAARRTCGFAGSRRRSRRANESNAKPVSVEGPKSEIRGQPAGAANPASAPPGTQPGVGHAGCFAAIRRGATKSSRVAFANTGAITSGNAVARARKITVTMTVTDLINRMKRYEKTRDDF